MQLTNEERAKIFMLYWGAEFRYDGSLGVRRKVMGTTRGLNIVDDRPEDFSYRVDKCKLLLTPLENISDEDAVQICKMRGASDYTLTHHKIRSIANICQILLWGGFSVEEFQFLISKSYAVPLWFGVEHPLNGEDAISLGIAIDKTTLTEVHVES